jgi:capsular exopolysaccharide synthesis family protein
MREMIQQPAGTNPGRMGKGERGLLGFDLRRYAFLMAKRWWILTLCFFAAVLMSLVMILKQEPKYQATAKIQLTRPVGLPSNLQSREQDSILGDYATTERNIILSEPVKSRAKELLGMTDEEWGKQDFSLSVDRLWETAILQISAAGREPKGVADYANAVVDAYVEYKLRMKGEQSQDTVTSLSQQATALSDQISEMEATLAEYRRTSGLVALEEMGNPAAAALGALSRQSMEFRVQRMLLEAQQPMLAQASDEVVLAALEYGAGTPGALAAAGVPGEAALGEDGTPVRPESLISQGIVAPPRWDDLKRENARLKAALETYRKKYKDLHPLIVETQRKLQENADAMQVELQFALNQYYSQLQALSIREKSAEQVEKSIEDQAEEIDRKRSEYASLERKLKRLNGLYDVVFNRLQEVDIASVVNSGSVIVLERAKVPGGPMNPRNLQTLFVAALLGLAAGIGIVLLLDFMDDSLTYPDEAEEALGASVLGVIPGAHWPEKSEQDRWVAKVDGSSSFAEAYRNLRSAILLNPVGAKCKTLAFVSSVPEEGKTTTCANLATSFAQSGKKVLVVDADLHRGKLHRLLGGQSGPGLSDILAGRLKWKDVVQKTEVPGLDFVATGLFPENPAEELMKPALRAFVKAAEAAYDLVIVDAPPVLAVSETSVLATLADAYLMVVWSGRTSRKLVKVAMQQLAARGATPLGVVLNNLELAKPGNYGAYSYYYQYYGYDYRYEDVTDEEEEALRATGADVTREPPERQG